MEPRCQQCGEILTEAEKELKPHGKWGRMCTYCYSDFRIEAKATRWKKRQRA